MPTAGGLYFWTHYFASEKWKNPLSFLVGYSNTIGLIGGICSIDCKSAHSQPYSNSSTTNATPIRWFRQHAPLRNLARPRRKLVRIKTSHLRHIRSNSLHTRLHRHLLRPDNAKNPIRLYLPQHRSRGSNRHRPTHRQIKQQPASQPGLVCIRRNPEPHNLAHRLGIYHGVALAHLDYWRLRFLRAYE